MRWFVNLKIGKKLLAGFMLIAIIAVLIGMIGIMNIKALYDSDAEMHDSLVAVSLMGDISSYFQRMRVNIADMVNAPTPNERTVDKEKALARKADMERALAEFETAISSPEEAEAVQRLHAQQKNFMAVTDRLIGLCEEGKTAEAQAIWRGEAETIRTDNQTVLTALVDIQKQEGESRSRINKEQASSAITMMIVLIVIGVVVAGAVAIFITRLITAPLAQGVRMMDELSKAHLGSRLALDRADEVGILANRMDGFADVLQDMVNNINTIAEGDLSVHIKPVDAHDEIAPAMIRIIDTLRSLVSEAGMLTTAAIEGRLQTRGAIRKFNGGYREIIEGVNRTLDTVMLPINEASAVLAALAGGDLTVRVQGEYRGDHQIITNSINALGESLDAALGDVLEASGATARASDEISSSAEQMAAGAHEQTQQAAEVASAIEEMSKTILETTRNANEAAAAAQRAGSSAKEGGRVVQETMDGMARIADVVKLSAATVRELGKSSDQIGEIVQVIDDIADQTNLLALNAAIEAARAGEQGRGFAVVADEVRKLAERTTKATKEIAEMIKQIQQETSHAMQVMDSGTQEVERGRVLAAQSGTSLREIIDDAGKVLDVVSQVAAASEEQSTAGEQIRRNIDAISNVTQESAAGTQQIARSAEHLTTLMTNLQGLIERFRITAKSRTPREDGPTSSQLRRISAARPASLRDE